MGVQITFFSDECVWEREEIRLIFLIRGFHIERPNTRGFTHIHLVLKMKKQALGQDAIMQGSQPVDHNLFDSQMTFSQGSPKIIEKHRYLHYDS